MSTDTLEPQMYESEATGDWISPRETIVGKKANTIAKTPAEEYPYVLIGNKVIQRNCLPNFAKHLSDQVEKQSAAFREHLVSMLANTPMSHRWIEEGVEAPTNECRQMYVDTAAEIFARFQLIPLRVSPSVDEGITVIYRSSDANRSLVIEISNDLQIAGLVNQGKNIESVVQISSANDLRQLVDSYMKRA